MLIFSKNVLTHNPTHAHNIPTMKKQTEQMIRVHMHITKKIDDDLRELSEKTGASVAWLIRKAVEAYLAGQK